MWSSAPRFQSSTPDDRLMKWTAPEATAPPSSSQALRMPAPGDLSTAAVAMPPG